MADVGGEHARSAIRPGVPEYEVSQVATQAMIREIAATFPGADLLDTWCWFQSGVNTDGAHNPVTDRAVQAHDILSLNCFPMIGGWTWRAPCCAVVVPLSFSQRWASGRTGVGFTRACRRLLHGA